MAIQISIAGRQQSAHRMIQRWSGAPGGIGYLSRNSVQRAATMARIEYSPKERGLYLDKSSRIRVSAIGLVIAPDHEQDIVIYAGETYKILMPPEGPRMADKFIFYDLNVMFVSAP